MEIWLLNKAKPPRSVLLSNMWLKELEIMTVIERRNAQTLSWTLPGSGVIWGIFDTRNVNFCCAEGKSGGDLLCVFSVHLWQCHDSGSLIWGIFFHVVSEVCRECGINVYFNSKSVCDSGFLYHMECLCERALLQQ